jgi:hypothetical protein
VPGLSPYTRNLAGRIIAQLEDADGKLDANEVQELEEQVEERLPNF